MDFESLPTFDGNETKIAFLNQNSTIKTGENVKSMHNSPSVQVSKQSPHFVEICETMNRDLSPSMKDSLEEAEKSPYNTKRALDFTSAANTISVFQAGLNNSDTDRLRSSDINMRIPVIRGDSSSLQLCDSVSDEEVSMDLDSITEFARSPSPVLGKRSLQMEHHHCTDPAVTTQHDTLSIQRDDACSMGTEVGPLVDERTEKGDNSPPYSPRLESEFTNSPVVGNPSSIQLRVESDVTSAEKEKDTQSVIQNPTLAPIQLPLTVAPSGPAVSPEIPLHAILDLPTTTFPCANCRLQFTIFVPVVRADGKNLW